MRKVSPMPPCEFLWEKFSYNPLTGELIRRRDEKPVGTQKPEGYWATTVSYEGTVFRCYNHRLIWKWITGEEPSEHLLVEHRDENPSNNAWNNLRLTNDRVNRLNDSSKRGYIWEEKYKRWRVVFHRADGSRITRVVRGSEEEAKKVRKQLLKQFAPELYN